MKNSYLLTVKITPDINYLISYPQAAFTCSKLTIETLEHRGKA